MDAKIIATRDPFLAADPIWGNGRRPQDGPDAVVAAKPRLFGGPDAAFSWTPDLVIVLPSGGPAQSSGPAGNPSDGVTVRFQSAW